MSDYPDGYEEFRTYTRSAIRLEIEALTGRAPTVSAAQRERLSRAMLTRGLSVAHQRAADSAARTAAMNAIGTPEPGDSYVEEVFHWETAAALRAFADATAKRLLKEANAVEARSVPTGLEDVRELVKREVAAFHRDMHRGVWKEGERYEKGQMVTRQGSTWSCQRDNATGKPGDSPDFLLIVKAGRDAK